MLKQWSELRGCTVTSTLRSSLLNAMGCSDMVISTRAYSWCDVRALGESARVPHAMPDATLNLHLNVLCPYATFYTNANCSQLVCLIPQHFAIMFDKCIKVKGVCCCAKFVSWVLLCVAPCVLPHLVLWEQPKHPSEEMLAAVRDPNRRVHSSWSIKRVGEIIANYTCGFLSNAKCSCDCEMSSHRGPS